MSAPTCTQCNQPVCGHILKELREGSEANASYVSGHELAVAAGQAWKTKFNEMEADRDAWETAAGKLAGQFRALQAMAEPAYKKLEKERDEWKRLAEERERYFNSTMKKLAEWRRKAEQNDELNRVKDNLLRGLTTERDEWKSRCESGNGKQLATGKIAVELRGVVKYAREAMKWGGDEDSQGVEMADKALALMPLQAEKQVLALEQMANAFIEIDKIILAHPRANFDDKHKARLNELNAKLLEGKVALLAARKGE